MLYYISSCFIFIYLIIMIAVYCILLVVCTFIYLGLLEMTNKVEYENRYKENKKTFLKITKWYVIEIILITIYCFYVC